MYRSDVLRTIREDWVRILRGGLAAFGAMGLLVGAANAQTFPSQYANALQRAQYSVFTGDVNSDGKLDVLAKAKKIIILIDFDVPIPIVRAPASPTFVLLSDPQGNYSLTVSPAASIVDSSVWVAATHDLVFGDVLGTGSAAMLLRARGGQPSFLIVTSPSDGRPQLLQHLTVASLGIDISGSANSVALHDANQDGRADLILSTSGTMSSLLLAGTDGRFVKPQGNDSILVAWRLFCAALDSGDLTSALAQITTSSQQTYLPGLVGVGTDITTLSANWTQIKSVEVRSDYAVFSLINNYDGQRRIHTIVLVPEGGRWLLEQF